MVVPGNAGWMYGGARKYGEPTSCIGHFSNSSKAKQKKSFQFHVILLFKVNQDNI